MTDNFLWQNYTLKKKTCTVLYIEFLDEVAVLFLMVQFFVVGLRFLLQTKMGSSLWLLSKLSAAVYLVMLKDVLLNLYFCCFLFDGLFKCVQNYTSSKCR